MTPAPFTAASNTYIEKVGGQSTIFSPGSNTHLQTHTQFSQDNKVQVKKKLKSFLRPNLMIKSISSSAPQPTRMYSGSRPES